MFSFRYQPTTTRPERVLSRPRLVKLLNERFDHRLTLVVGSAGCGKTTALSQAVESNRLDPIGSDIWLGARPRDEEPAALLHGLARAIGIEVVPSEPPSLDTVCDAVWAQAPTDVTLIVDDSHHLAVGESAEVLNGLISELPTNGHLLLASRVALDLPTARLRAHDQLLDIDESILLMDDEEVQALIEDRASKNPATRSASIDQLPRHIATADLQLVAGANASAGFLWEEVLSSIDDDRLDGLQRIAVLDEVDDDIVDRLTGGRSTLQELIEGLPLVDQLDDGTARLHRLLRDALLDQVEPSERRKHTAVAAEIARERGTYHVAIELALEADDYIAVRDLARDSVLRHPSGRIPEETGIVLRCVRKAEPSAALLVACELSNRGTLGPSTIGDFARAAELARAEGDDVLESTMWFRCAQSVTVSHVPVDEQLINRLDELAANQPVARAMFNYIQSCRAQFQQGDIRQAIDLVNNTYSEFGHEVGTIMRCERLFDLGRFDQIDLGLPTTDFMKLPPGSQGYVALAMWLRGDFDPDTARLAADEFVNTVLIEGGTHTSIVTFSSGLLACLAQGDWDRADELRKRSREVAAQADVATTPLIWEASAAAAAAATIDGDEDRAAELLRFRHPEPLFTTFPHQGQLPVLALMYVVTPEARDRLDRLDAGTTLSVAIAAGRAVVAARDGDVSPSLVLPWTESNLLRSNVIPTHLAELACAALADDNRHGPALALLDTLPHQSTLLKWVIDHGGPQAADVARDRFSALPPEPTSTVEITLLGSMTLTVDGQPVLDNEWQRRPRVRELLALLIERGRAERSDLIAEMWPGHDDENKAMSNLRTTLGTLNKVLEPHRSAEREPSVLRNDGTAITVSETISTDVSRFERLLATAQADDSAGLPQRALESLLEAIEIYQGDYLDGLSSAWTVLPRIRLQALAVGALCRAGELLAAKGEPEAAMRLAERARNIEPTHDRAGRLMINALAATGNATAARAAASHLAATYVDHGIELSPATRRVLERHGGLAPQP